MTVSVKVADTTAILTAVARGNVRGSGKNRGAGVEAIGGSFGVADGSVLLLRDFNAVRSQRLAVQLPAYVFGRRLCQDDRARFRLLFARRRHGYEGPIVGVQGGGGQWEMSTDSSPPPRCRLLQRSGAALLAAFECRIFLHSPTEKIP